jgi:hypothetical protein
MLLTQNDDLILLYNLAYILERPSERFFGRGLPTPICPVRRLERVSRSFFQLLQLFITLEVFRLSNG